MSLLKTFKHYRIQRWKIALESLIIFFISTIISLLVLIKLVKMVTDLPFLISPLAGLIAAVMLIYRKYGRYFKLQSLYTFYSAYVINSLVVEYSATKSIFKAIRRIAFSKIPEISRDFMEILSLLVTGENPHAVIREYAEKQPSEVFKSGLLSFLTLVQEGKMSPDYTLQKLDIATKGRIREVEVKITVFITFLFFLPMLILLGVSLYELPSSYLWLAPILQVLVGEVFRNSLTFLWGFK
ncbi:hypothetical protein DRN86_01635 [Candidatus Geothermarchaeota archaeon]|nr:MAG: hypothetical protein DRN86_01635 [Candidatus Geothermarchaeota archaeon]